MLKIENITVKTNGKKILKNLFLNIDKGEVLVLFGPNGSGKSTLLKSIMGISGYKVTEGRISFMGKSISMLSTSERAKRGFGMMFQHPPKIYGVKLSQISDYLCGENKNEIEKLSDELKIKDFLSRDLNVDLSGGEMKRVELFQVLLQKPKMLLLDEPESGVDVENISIMGKVLNEYLEKTDCACLIITHTGYILEHVKAKKGCVIMDGEIFCSGSPERIFKVIQEHGYEKCKGCERMK